MLKGIIAAISAIVLVTAGCTGHSSESDPTADLALIRQRVVELYTGNGLPFDEPGEYVTAAREAMADRVDSLIAGREWGVWPSPDQGREFSGRVTGWYRNMLVLAQAYHVPGQRHYKSETVKVLLKETLDKTYVFIRRGSNRSGNWYGWFIGIPRELCPLLYFTEEMYGPEFHQKQVAALVSLTENGPDLSGQNGIWEGYNALLQAALLNDHALAEKAMGFINRESSLALHSGGVLEDYSYQFHNRILYSGAYGGGYVMRMALTIFLTRGTGYELPRAKRELYARYMDNHGCRTYMRGCYDLAVKGRDNRYGGNPTPANMNGTVISAFLETDERTALQAHAAGLVADIAKPLPLMAAPFADRLDMTGAAPATGFRYFYRSDYGTFRQPGFYMSIKMLSDHVMDYEGNWGANLNGWNLSNGATYVSRTGREMWPDGTIHPGWDWEHIPGTTSRLGTRPEKSYNMGTAELVGGAGCDDNGVAGFELVPVTGDFTARKSYFTFVDGFMAVGSGITSYKKGKAVSTTLGQWPLDADDIVVRTDGYVLADSVVYVPFGNNRVRTVRKNGVLTVLYDHGTHPQNGHYAYAVLPRCTEGRAAEFAAAPSVKILSRTDALHAYLNTVTGDLGMVFFEPGTCEGVAVDKPAVVYLKNATEGKELTLAGLLHDETGLTLTVTSDFEVTTLPEGARQKRQGNVAVVYVPATYGRPYRIGLGSVAVRQIEHEYTAFMRTFRCEFEQGDSVSLLTITVPDEFKEKAYELCIHRIKGQFQCFLTDADIVKRHSDGRITYRWVSRDKRRDVYYVRLVYGNYGVNSTFNLL